MSDTPNVPTAGAGAGAVDVIANGSASVPASSASTTVAPVTVAAPAAATAAAIPSRPYNPNAQLSQLDALALPDETENDRLTRDLDSNVASLLATKQANERKQQHVGSVLASKVRAMEEEQRKLQFIRSELLKLDHHLSKNIDVLRSEIEQCGRECNTLQFEFDRKEKEYLECRKLLAKSKQRKLLLTSHLDYIILTNENEKASKLAELERTLGLPPSTPTTTMHALPTPPPPATATMDENTSKVAHTKSSILPSNGPSPAVVAAAAESAARHAAALAKAHIPADHPGLRLDAVAPPSFSGFDEVDSHTHPSIIPPPSSTTNPFGPPTPIASISSTTAAAASLPSPPSRVTPTAATRIPQPSAPSAASIATSRHVSINGTTTKSKPSSNTSHTTPTPTPRSAQSALSIANKKKGTPLTYTPDGQFAGFADE